MFSDMPRPIAGSGDSVKPFAFMVRGNQSVFGICIPSLVKDYKYVKLMTPQDWVDNGGRSTEGNLITISSIGIGIDGVSAGTLTTSPTLVSSLNLETASEMDVYFAAGGNFQACAVMFYN